jgi:ApbE superfamily uncharacterized protein (UPF0280 family)
MRAQIQFLPDGRRLHLHDGPIDLIVEAWGPGENIEVAYAAATRRFLSVLDELCGELTLLRKAVEPDTPNPEGCIARLMMEAVRPFSPDRFITPMAAVAGAVAENILCTMTDAAELTKAYVNNGGDIAIHLSAGEHFTVGMVDRPDCPSLIATASLDWMEPVRGIATSGWRGRSFSLGVADAVTVLADRAANADAAATIVANAVDLPGHSAIVRIPARELAPDSDLGDIKVTQHVGDLSRRDVADALDAGERAAEALVERGLIHSAALRLRAETRIVTFEDKRVGRFVHA